MIDKIKKKPLLDAFDGKEKGPLSFYAMGETF